MFDSGLLAFSLLPLFSDSRSLPPSVLSLFLGKGSTQLSRTIFCALATGSRHFLPTLSGFFPIRRSLLGVSLFPVFGFSFFCGVQGRFCQFSVFHSFFFFLPVFAAVEPAFSFGSSALRALTCFFPRRCWSSLFLCSPSPVFLAMNAVLLWHFPFPPAFSGFS